MTLTPLLRLLSPLARRPAAPAAQMPQTPTPTEADAASLQRLISQAGLCSLYSLCDQIDEGYDSGKCMYDNGMSSLAETLTSSTGEIKHLIEQYARMRSVLLGLDGYGTFEVTGLECDDELQVLKNAALALITADQAGVAHA